MGQQGVDIGGGSGAEAAQDVFEPDPKVDLVRLAGGGKTLPDGQMSAAAFTAGKKPVFTSKGDRADHVFHRIVVDIQFGIGEEFRQFRFQIQRISDRFSQR